ncbi:hypothetical protein TVAG_109700 [Trichomonas vaginalis G3]|uniref:Uncharacterized protein n=1 Tax=Trichomonas vaginalis (strain ATCC PRA-98 / G3) TaxID=412133 RepID=A2EAF9_TRIV3|nr:hypothetical protein TVAG_109700 [Trichomonas vaginalis G3]|eukprot:XP_001322609.1 hypothetical protein [Trichomonas vaginalis G3]
MNQDDISNSEMAVEKHSSKSYKDENSHSFEKTTFDNTNETQLVPVSVADIRGEIRQLDSNLKSSNDFDSFLEKPTRPISPYTGKPGRRIHKSQIAPSGSDFDRGITQGGNTLDIWIKTSPFFRQLPSDEQIDKLFTVPSIPQFKRGEKSQKWEETISKYVDSTRKTGDASKVEKIPKKRDYSQEVARYWIENSASFPIDKSIKKNKTRVHCLICGLVPEEITENNKNSEENKIRITKVPQIEGGPGYVSLSVEERLNAELQYVGMLDDDTDIVSNDDDIPFSADLGVLSTHINKMRPIVEEFQRNVVNSLPTFRYEDEKRKKIENDYAHLISAVKKAHKKQ